MSRFWIKCVSIKYFICLLIMSYVCIIYIGSTPFVSFIHDYDKEEWAQNSSLPYSFCCYKFSWLYVTIPYIISFPGLQVLSYINQFIFDSFFPTFPHYISRYFIKCDPFWNHFVLNPMFSTVYILFNNEHNKSHLYSFYNQYCILS